MADFLGTSGNDVLTGTAAADTMSGGAGNDRLNSGAGDDIIFGGLGNDTLTGDAGNDQIFGEEGNDGIYGGGGNDTISGGAGIDTIFGDGANDTIDGGADNDKLNGGTGDDRLNGDAGNDTLTGDAGNDVLIVKAGEGSDALNGGLGLDRAQIELSSADVTAALRADMANYKAWADQQLAAANGDSNVLAQQSTGPTFTFTSLGLTISAIEAIEIRVDGVVQPLSSFLNQAPVAEAVVVASTNEDQVLTGQVIASDADGDVLGYGVVQGPQYGVLSLDANTGAYVYTPGANYAGSDAFSVRVTDPSGASVVQQVQVGIAAVADVPDLAVSDAAASAAINLAGTTGNDVLSGGAGSDVISGNAGNDTLSGDGGTSNAAIKLDIAAALGDLDGSEMLSVVIVGVPSGALLSAGTRNADGTWSLTAGQLAGLSMTASTAVDIALSVTATARESSGAEASTTKSLNVTFGRGGSADVLDGGAGNDTLNGGIGNDRLSGGDGNDIVNGDAGDDLIIADAGLNTIDGGAGFDTIDFSLFSSAVSLDLSKSLALGAGSGKITSVEGAIGTNFSDSITGSSADNVISGGRGDDKLYGSAGRDTVSGGDGADLVDGGSGDDVLADGAGNDTVNGGSDNDTLIAGLGDDAYVGGSGFDTLDFSAATKSIAVDVSKKTVKGQGNDTIDGIEKFIGSSFNDTFKGSKAGDVFDGGAGADVMRGLGGADTLTGGDGGDTFTWFKKDVAQSGKYSGRDVVTDFQPGDKLDLRDFTKSLKGASIDTVVKFTDTSAGTILSVKVGGAFYEAALLEGVHGADASSYLANGVILA